MSGVSVVLDGVEYVTKLSLDALQEKYDRERTGATELEDELVRTYGRIRDLELMLKREVEAHRNNCNELNAWMQRAIRAEDRLNKGARAFMDLHDWAKDVVGPKVRPQAPVLPWCPDCTPRNRNCHCG